MANTSGYIKTTRFPHGITNVPVTSTCGSLGQPDPSRIITFFDDFINESDLVAASPTSWTVTKIGSSTIVANAAYSGGSLTFTTAASASDSTTAQLNTGAFLFTAGKKLLIKTQFTPTGVSGQAIIIGLQAINTTPTATTQGIYLSMAAGGVITVVCATGSATTTSTTVATAVAATQISVGMVYEPNALVVGSSPQTYGAINIFVNDALITSIAVTNAPTAALSPIIYNKGNAQVLDVDYLLVCQDR